MRPLRLDLRTLRRRQAPRAPVKPTPREVLESDDAVSLSRREILGMMGLVGALPVLHTTGTTLLGSVEVVRGRGRIAFRLRGEERWVLDVRRYGGRPRLDVEQDEGGLTVRLTGATYPGLRLPADVDARLLPTWRGWQLRLRLAGGFDATLRLEPWLLGLTAARGRLHLADEASAAPARVGLWLEGRAEATYRPDGTLRLAAPGLAALRAPDLAPGLADVALAADHVEVALAAADAPSLMATPLARRSVVTLARGAHAWPIEPPLGETDAWMARADADLFDRLLLEAGESRSGRVYHALVAEADDGDGALTVEPSPALRSLTGGAFALPLRRARYALALDEATPHAVLAADFGAGSAWLHTDQGSLLLGGASDDGAPAFVCSAVGRRLEAVDCRPPLRATALPPAGDGVIAEPVAAAPGARIALISDEAPGPEGGANRVRFGTGRRAAPQVTLANQRVRLIRPDDLVVLEFSFHNVSLQGGEIEGPAFQQAPGGTAGPTLVPTGSPAYLVAHFQGQHVGERAYFEVDPSVAVGGGDIDASTGNETPPSNTTAPARLAGPSRLVFKVTGPIPYTLEGLLEACRTLELNVAPTARPPARRILANVQQGLSLAAPLGAALPARAQLDRLAISPGDVEAATLEATLREASAPVFRGAALLGQEATHVVQQRATPEPRAGQRAATARQAPVRRVPTRLLLADEPATAAQVIRRHRDVLIAQASPLVEVVPGLFDDFAVPILPTPEPPTATQTAIEAPYRLLVSPHRYSGWAHATAPVANPDTGRVELWHTRLGSRYAPTGQPVRVIEDNDYYRTLRAIWYADPHRSDSQKGTVNQAPSPGDKNPFRMALSPFDRHNLVHLTANFGIGGYTPLPARMNRFMLSALGAWIDGRGAWDPPTGLSVEEWLHRGTLGRDHYVKVVYQGFLFPFGHRASLVKVTERKFHTNRADNPAFLRQRMYIVVREPTVAAGLTGKQDGEGRSYDRWMPFKRATITSLVTPNLDNPEQSDVDNLGQGLFWPRVGAADFPFTIQLEDVEGQVHDVTMPLAFVDKSVAEGDEGALEALASSYAGAARSTVALGGASLALAEAATPGDTAFEAETVGLGADVDFAQLSVERLRVFPTLRQANVRVPALQQMTGDATATALTLGQTYLTSGFDAGANQGEVFLELVGAAPLDFSDKADKAGGLAQPNMTLSGLSRAVGPVAGDLANATSASFDPADVFASLSPKLLGVINLADVIAAFGLDRAPAFVTEALGAVEAFLTLLQRFKDDVAPDLQGALQATTQDVVGHADALLAALASPDLQNLPAWLGGVEGELNALLADVDALLGLLPGASGLAVGVRKQAQQQLGQVRALVGTASEFVDAIERFAQAIEDARQMKVRLAWEPPLQDWPAADPIFIITQGPNGSDTAPGRMTVAVEMQAKTDGKTDASLTAYAALEHFAVDLVAPASFLKVTFDRLVFFAEPGKKAGVDCVFGGLEFLGPLSFIERLRDLIPLDGFSDPPFVDVDAQGITAGFTFPIPDVAVGVFAMTNMSLGASVNIPFIGEPLSLSFNFNTRENPCSITVLMLGGGAFFGLTISPAGMIKLEAAIEFGAELSINLVVAAGKAGIKAGIYFCMEKDPQGKQTALLSGYLRIYGKLSILALVSVSIELKMELSFEFTSGKVVGRATITIEIELLFFTIPVEVSCERKFAGSNGDPTFRDAMGTPYLDYVAGAQVDPWVQYCEAFA